MAPLVSEFLLRPLDPAGTLKFEESLRDLTRELGRQVLEWTLNAAEPDAAAAQPHDVQAEEGGFRRLRDKTPNRHVATTFGCVTLWRRGYRSWGRDDGERTIFPLERQLGLLESATPVLAGRIAQHMAGAGATQGLTLQWLEQEHQLAIGAARLRRRCEQVAAGLEVQRERAQEAQVLAWLVQAEASRGRNRPVLAVGRDGITLNVQGVYEVASTATVSVYDRAGHRLGTVYLAQPSEAHQTTLSDQLTRLIQRVLRAVSGALPRLCYVTDAGDAETQYYRRVLRPMRDPRNPRLRLTWFRIVDYFHVSERLTILGDALKFADARERWAWITKMRKLLKKPGGVGRVLHSAAALAARLGVRKAQRSEFEKARNYLRNQSSFAHYAEYKRLGLPIGSGVTEAACKTIFTQRLKLSGMQWSRPGAQVILQLRIILLSGIWDQCYQAFVASHTQSHMAVHQENQPDIATIAA